MKKYKGFLLVFLSLGLFAILSGCYLFPKEETLLAPPLMQPAKVSYSVIEAVRGDIEKRIAGFGTFVSVEQQYMFFRHRGGRIKQIHVRLGDEVKKGDLLAELYTDNLESQILQQRLVLRKTKIAYNQVKSSGGSSYALELASIDTELAQIRLDDLLLELEQSMLLSEISGRVVYVDSRLSPGDFVNAYQNIIRIADPFTLQLQYTGTNIANFSVGNEVEVKIKEKVYNGTVVSTPGTVPSDGDENLRNVVRITVADLPEEVTMGQNGDISLVLERSADTIIIPKQAVRNYMGRKYVNILEDGLNNERDVEIGIETATEVEITKGIEEGEQIILR